MPMNLPVTEMPLPIRFRPPAPMTDDELLVFCERNEVVWIEREANGDISIKPIPGTLVGGIKMDVTLDLHLWSESVGRGEVLSGVGFSLPDGSMLGAYIAWLSREKLRSVHRGGPKRVSAYQSGLCRRDRRSLRRTGREGRRKYKSGWRMASRGDGSSIPSRRPSPSTAPAMSPNTSPTPPPSKAPAPSSGLNW